MLFWGSPRFNLPSPNSDTPQPAWIGRLSKNCPLYISISNTYLYIGVYLYMCAFFFVLAFKFSLKPKCIG
jgi:hypothetical protein